jgi:2-polyprenyl-3-methyl-5-hydroxy-6-metoxy-1,4-benzoquinol methylase
MSRDTDTDWNRVAETDPYWGVISAEKFRGSVMAPDALTEFMAGGEAYVNGLFGLIRKPVDPNFAPAKVLDFGCGYGRIAPLIMRTADSYHGVDVIPERIEYARRTYGSDKVTFDVVNPETPLTGCYDAIVCITVLQHLYLPGACEVLQRLHRLTASNGRVYLWDGRIYDRPIEELEAEYAKPECAEHMIPKPLSVLREAAPFDWVQVDDCRWELTPKRRRGRPRRA